MTEEGDGGGRQTERERRGIRDERRSGNPSAGVSGEEGVMTGRSYGPQGGEGWREVGDL